MTRLPARTAAALLTAAALGLAGCTSDPGSAGAPATTAPAPSATDGPASTGPSDPSIRTPETADPATTATSGTPASDTAVTSDGSASATGRALPAGRQQPAGEPVDIVTGLAAPWSVVFVGDTALVSERDTATIREIVDGRTRVVGVVDGVQARGEGGLLGLATYPTAAPTHLYVYSTGADDNRIVRYPLIGTAGSFGLGPVEEVFSGIVKNSTHNGGRIAFGPDGMLYVTTGDAQQRDTPQDPESVNGKILRLTPDGGVPADNPIAGNPLYSLGHRNPQGLAWDATGQLWAAEFGQNTWDELNRIEPGANYGWPEVEGIAGVDGFVDPVQQWPTDQASPSGITIAGDTIFIANLRGQRLRAVNIDDPSGSTTYVDGGYGRLRDVVVAPDGTLWILTNNTDGRGDPQDGDDRILGVALTPA